MHSLFLRYLCRFWILVIQNHKDVILDKHILFNYKRNPVPDVQLIGIPRENSWSLCTKTKPHPYPVLKASQSMRSHHILKLRPANSKSSLIYLENSSLEKFRVFPRVVKQAYPLSSTHKRWSNISFKGFHFCSTASLNRRPNTYNWCWMIYSMNTWTMTGKKRIHRIGNCTI